MCNKLNNEKDVNIGKIIRIKSGHRKEFENGIFFDYCDKHGIAHEFSAPKHGKISMVFLLILHFLGAQLVVYYT